jgi:DNA recombination protein RmuC
VIDAKFPLDGYQRAAAAHDGAARAQYLAAHAAAVAGHVRALAQREYPSSVKESLDFTVCYVPSDDLLTAAYEQNPGLFYAAVQGRVLIATPVTLLAVLWGIAYGLQRDARVAQAGQIGDAAATLHKRAGIMASHMRQTGRSLEAAIRAYNEMVGSFKHRLLPQLRRIEGMAILAPGSAARPGHDRAGAEARHGARGGRRRI